MEPHKEANVYGRTMHPSHETLMLNITWEDKKKTKWIKIRTGVKDIIYYKQL